MAGRIPELKDLEAALEESVDVESAQNAYHEYRKRGGLNHGDAASEALRKRATALRGPQETFTKEGWTEKPAGAAKSVGSALSDAVELVSRSSPGSAPALPTAPAGSNALTTTKIKGALLPALPAAQIAEAWRQWNDIANALLDRAQDISLIHGKEHLNITFWRKIKVAYQVEAYERGDPKWSYEPLKCEIKMGFRAPNGMTTTSIGIASRAEERLKGASDHDLMARAWSRAFTRGMRDLIGFGSPSAEEVE